MHFRINQGEAFSSKMHKRDTFLVELNVEGQTAQLMHEYIE